MIISKSDQREQMCDSMTFTLWVICCIILVNIRLVFWRNIWVTLKEKKGEGDWDTAHTFTPVANQIIFESPNGWFSSLCDLPAWRSTSVAPWPVIGYALNGKAIIDLGHRQCEGSAPHYQPQSPRQKKEGQREKMKWRVLAKKDKENRLKDRKESGWEEGGKYLEEYNFHENGNRLKRGKWIQTDGESGSLKKSEQTLKDKTANSLKQTSFGKIIKRVVIAEHDHLKVGDRSLV